MGSSCGKDVWSLRKIVTGIGAELSIKYESDDYSKSVLNRNGSLLINTFSNLDVNTGSVSFTVASAGVKLSEIFTVNDKIDFIALQPVRYDPDPYGSSLNVPSRR